VSKAGVAAISRFWRSWAAVCFRATLSDRPTWSDVRAAVAKATECIMIRLNVNGHDHEVDAEPDTPLLYILRGELELNGAKFGCGLGQCGACTVLVDGQAVFSCVTPIGLLIKRHVVTIEGLGMNAVQRAFIDEQAAQCGYCIAGMVMRAQALLQQNPRPSEQAIRSAMAPNLCRCGTHMRILAAVRRAAVAVGSARETKP
jgi:nicotinate dehydrogenase subunit A